MTLTNNQFSTDTISLLKSLKGKKLDSIAHEPYVEIPSSYGMVLLSIDKQKYAFTAYEEPMDYFGAKEDISSAKFEVNNEATSPSVTGVKFVMDKIGQKVSRITAVNAEKYLKVKETGKEYAFLDTLGVIFTLENGTQLSLIKAGIFETIYIYQGFDPKSKIHKLVNNYLGNFSSKVEGKFGVNYIDL